MKFNHVRTILGSIQIRLLVRAALISSASFCIVLALWPANSAKCDEFGCDGTLCDSAHTCNRGCKCVYPQGASIGHCEVWARR